ncbi:MAG TPA: hypothetical protein VHY79_11400 [Rhizomicrobium sp.]|nr:hypothetical protein [Rhizomicrobium sp.]
MTSRAAAPACPRRKSGALGQPVFFPGVDLEDPQGFLNGSGTKCQHIVLRSPAMLDDPGVSNLMRRALEKSDHPIDARAEARIVIKSI